VAIYSHLLWVYKDVTEFDPNPNVQIQNPMDFQCLSDSDSAYKLFSIAHIHHLSQSAISRTKVSKYTMILIQCVAYTDNVSS